MLHTHILQIDVLYVAFVCALRCRAFPTRSGENRALPTRRKAEQGAPRIPHSVACGQGLRGYGTIWKVNFIVKIVLHKKKYNV